MCSTLSLCLLDSLPPRRVLLTNVKDQLTVEMSPNSTFTFKSMGAFLLIVSVYLPTIKLLKRICV